MQTVPIQAVPNQNLQVQLGSQACTLEIYQYAYGLFINVYVSGVLIIGGVICENLNRIVRDAYLGFVGDFVWFDTQGKSDPVYTGLGSRFLLVYLEQADVGQETAAATGIPTPAPAPPPEEPIFYIAE
jgi:hypothetical protein